MTILQAWGSADSTCTRGHATCAETAANVHDVCLILININLHNSRGWPRGSERRCVALELNAAMFRVMVVFKGLFSTTVVIERVGSDFSMKLL